MSSWVVVPCLLSLRDEFNYVAPNRDKGADGTIGDTSHSSTSDHTPDEDSNALKGKDSDSKNEVHALDIDSSGVWPYELSFDSFIKAIIKWEKSKWFDANDKCRLNYIIWNHKLYDKDNDWNPVNYTGSDPHTNHAHFSARYDTSSENDTRPWGVIEWSENNMDDATIDKIATRTADKVWGYMLTRPNGPDGNGSPYTKAGDYQRYNDVVNANTANAAAEHVIEELSDNVPS